MTRSVVCGANGFFMRTDLKKQEINVQDHVAQHYEDMRYRLSHSRRYHLWWTTEMLKGTKDTGLWLDLGCGTGWNLSVLQLLEHKRKAIGIDLSDGMLRLAKEKKLNVIRGDAQQLPFCDASFDGILAKGVLHHLSDVEKAAAEIARVLKPGGIAVMVDPNPSLLRKFQTFLKNREEYFSHLHRSIPPAEYQSIISRYLQIIDFRYFGLIAYPMAFPDILPLKGFLRLNDIMIQPLIRLDKLAARLPFAQWLCWAFMLTGRKE